MVYPAWRTRVRPSVVHFQSISLILNFKAPFLHIDYMHQQVLQAFAFVCNVSLMVWERRIAQKCRPVLAEFLLLKFNTYHTHLDAMILQFLSTSCVLNCLPALIESFRCLTCIGRLATAAHSMGIRVAMLLVFPCSLWAGTAPSLKLRCCGPCPVSEMERLVAGLGGLQSFCATQRTVCTR